MPDRPIPDEHEIARAAQRAVEDYLAPCIPTRLGQGDDYGLDAFVQHVVGGHPPIRTALLFGLQVKGRGAELADNHQEQLQVSHLSDWTASPFSVLIAVHTIKVGVTRWRFAHEIVKELDTANGSWRTQTTVSISFSKQYEHSKEQFHEWLNHSLLRTTDNDGGITRFHRSNRSVLLTELYHEQGFVGQHFRISEQPNGPAIADCLTGMQWASGEVDERRLAQHGC